MPRSSGLTWRGIRFQLAIALIALLGVGITLYSTSLGIGSDADTATYLMTARSILAGKGLTMPTADGRQVPMTGFPPLLPVALAAFGFLGLDLLAAVRWLHAFLFGADILVAGFLVQKYTRSGPAAVFAALLTATAADVLFNYSVLISEPLFLAFALAGVLMVGLYTERPVIPLLLCFSVAFALACATRYAGVSLLPVGAAAIMVGAGPARRRWIHLAAFLAIFGVPASLWAFRNLALVGDVSSRVLAFHPPPAVRFEYAALSFSTWLLPSTVPSWFRVLALTAGIFLLFRPLLQRRITNLTRPWSFLDVAGIFVVSYVLLLLIAQTFFDAQIWISGRHVLAVYLTGVIVAVCQGKELLDRANPRVRAACIVSCFLLAGIGIARVARNAVHFHQEGIGLSSSRWRNSPLAAKVKELDPRTPLLSNSGAALYLLTGRLAHSIPERFNSQSHRIRPEYDAELVRMKRQLLQEGGVAVIFNVFGGSGGFPSESEGKELELEKIAITDDGYLLAKRLTGDAASAGFASSGPALKQAQ